MNNYDDSNIIDITPDVVEYDIHCNISDEDVNNHVDKILNRLEYTGAKLDGLMISKSDLSEADVNRNNSIAEAEQNKELIDILDPIFNKYNELYNTDLKFDDFKSALTFASLANKSDKDIKRVINAEVITNTCEYIIIKGILVSAKLIDSQINAIQSKMYTENLSVEAVTLVSQIFSWIEKLEIIKDKFKQYDIETKIKNIAESSSTDEDAKLEFRLIDLLKKSIQSGGPSI